jgi:beta-ribofuranosylaminobenzene 5'-phosphate synthase
MSRVAAPSRLHFGLMGVLAGAAGLCGVRRFGSVGLMIEAPGIHLRAEPATSWSADGPLAERALAIARSFAQTPPPDGAPGGSRPVHLHIEQAVPEHAGLGSGTQLALSVARALSLVWGWPALDAVELARRVGRGRRSGLGVHGFAHGGFLVDGGKGAADALAPLLVQAAFPEPWRVVVALPPGASGLHGPGEHQAFAELAGQQPDLARTDALCRLVLLGMLPALAERDLDAFGAAVHEFNARAGEAFAPVQGGVYASPLVAEVVAFVRRQGVRGAGQSSWGPAVFALVGDEERGADLARRLGERFGLEAPRQVLMTRASAHGATWEG